MENTIISFYEALSRKDAETMIQCYHKNVIFKDPAFGELNTNRVKNMWRMLCQSQLDKEFLVTYKNVKHANTSGSAEWEAVYYYGRQNKKVHNKIHAYFEFKDGLIFRHTDHFKLWNWACQALGPTGCLIGWTPYFKRRIQIQTNKMIDKFEAKQSL